MDKELMKDIQSACIVKQPLEARQYLSSLVEDKKIADFAYLPEKRQVRIKALPSVEFITIEITV